LLKLLLECRELGEWRIGIRLLIATAGAAERFGVILLAVSAIHAVAALAAWPLTTWAAILSFDPLALSLKFLLALVPVLALLAIDARPP
jgi:hypothetical protein